MIYLLIIKDVFVIENLGWFVSYTSNILFYIKGGLVDVWSNHLWTLAVEEQFYLLFPILILFVSKKNEYWLPALFISIAIIFKYMNMDNGKPKYLLMIAQTDMLGVGILLGILKNRHEKLFMALSSKRFKILMLFALLCCTWTTYHNEAGSFWSHSFRYWLLIFFGLLVANAAIGFKGIVGFILDNNVLQYLGKISYGLYLYHKVIPLSLLIVLKKFNLQIDGILAYYLVNMVILFIVSHVSWKLIESPILKLKSKFAY